ncbi:MAG: 30S ribosomal protein S6 [Deinococcales bacterium]
MVNYDLNIILSPNLNPTQIQAEKDLVTAQVERYSGEIANLDEWGNTRLAYPIRKQTEGYYLIYNLNLEGSAAPKAIEQALRLRDNVMRVLIVRERPEWRTLGKRKIRIRRRSYNNDDSANA